MNRKNLIRHLTKNAEIVLEVEQDDIPVRGNAMASGDDAYDRKVEDGIIARLDRGDVWAWAFVQVFARYDGCEGHDSLGACCYENEAAFRADAYFEDMRDAAIASLADELIDRQERAEKLAAELKQRDCLNGKWIEYTGHVDENGYREFVFLDGMRAGTFGVRWTKVERDAHEECYRLEFREPTDEPVCDKCGDVGGGAEPGQKCGRVDDGAQQPCDGSYQKGGA